MFDLSVQMESNNKRKGHTVNSYSNHNQIGKSQNNQNSLNTPL